MGLRDTIQNAAVAAITAIGDLAETMTYVQVTDTSPYDPEKDIVRIEGTETTGIIGAFVDFEEKDNFNDIRQGDQKGLIPALNLKTAGGVLITSEVGDRIHRSATEHWEVKNREIDTAGALWILHMRQVQIGTVVAP